MNIFRLSKSILDDTNAKYKGAVGEVRVRSKLNPILFGKVYHKLINNIILKDVYGNTHQIDHIEIRSNGIFCIETKNIKGFVCGDCNSKYWHQLLGSRKFSIRNPLEQNMSHIYTICNILNNEYRVYSVIVMVENNASRLKIPCVVNLNDLRSYLENFNDGTNYSNDEIDDIYNRIIEKKVYMKTSEHVKYIRNVQMCINNNICPRCGSKLVLRNGKFGAFYGCSNYPKCTFTKK